MCKRAGTRLRWKRGQMTESSGNTLLMLAGDVFLLCGIPVGKVVRADSCLEYYYPKQYHIPFFLESEIIRAGRTLKDSEVCLVEKTDYPLIYCIINCGGDCIILLGPVFCGDFTPAEQRAYRRTAGAGEYRMYSVLPSVFRAAARLMSTGCGADYRTCSDLEESETKSDLEPVSSGDILSFITDQLDSDYKNHALADEEYILNMIKNGSSYELQEALRRRLITYPDLTTGSDRRIDEYMAAGAITLFARAAIEGGVTTAESFLLSDVYLKKLSECHSIAEILRLRDKACIDFAGLVENGRIHVQDQIVEDARKYIANHVFSRLSLEDVAREIGVEKTYLARRFMTVEGITVCRYIRRSKIDMAKNMLTYSDRSILEISDYLSFRSESYFGRLFRMETSVSPSEYRKGHHASDF